MLTSNTTKNSSMAAINYNAYAKALGIFVMTTGMFLFAKATGYLFPWFLSRKAEEDTRTALITADETQSVVPLMEDTISFNEENILEMEVAAENSMPTDPANSEQVQFTELTLSKDAQIKEEPVDPEIYQKLQTSRRLMMLPSTSEFLVNSYTAGTQATPDIASLANGNFVVTWQGNQGVSWDIYGQICTPAGTPIGSEFLINTYTTGSQYSPSSSGLTNGNFVVTWYGNSDSSTYGVSAQIFTPEGVKVGSQFIANTYSNNSQGSPSIASLTNGNFVIAWHSDLQDGSSSGVYSQVFSSAGLKLGNEFLVNTYTTTHQDNPSVAGLTNGDFVIVWRSYQQDGSDTGVYGQIFTSAGEKVESEFRVNTYIFASQDTAAVAGISEGNFVVTWQSDIEDGSNYGIYGQIFNSAGIKLGNEFLVNTHTEGSQSWPCISSLINSNFMISWSSSHSGSYGVYAQMFTSSGTKIGNEFLISTDTTISNRISAITCLTEGDCAVVWQGYKQDEDIYAKVFRLLTVTNCYLNIAQGQSLVLNTDMFSATSGGLHTDITFTITNPLNGWFSLNSAPNVAITQFTQQQIIDGEILFVHDGSSNAPTFIVTVTDGQETLTPVSASIDFIPTTVFSSTGNSLSSTAFSSSLTFSNNPDASSTAVFSATGEASSGENDQGRSSSTTHHSEAESSTGSELSSPSSANTWLAAYNIIIGVAAFISAVGVIGGVVYKAGKCSENVYRFFRGNTEKEEAPKIPKNKFSDCLYKALKNKYSEFKNFASEKELLDFSNVTKQLEDVFDNDQDFRFQSQEKIRFLIDEHLNMLSDIIAEIAIDLCDHDDFIASLQYEKYNILEKTKEKISEENLEEYRGKSNIQMSRISQPVTRV